MRILWLTQWFTPEPGFKGLTFARELVRQGHLVEVLTGFPNYPGGRLYPGYRVRPLQREIRDGIRIVRVPLVPSHSQSRIGRVLNYGSFAMAAATIGAVATKKADVACVYHPPPTIGLAAMSLRLLRGLPFVYEVQDLWPDTLAATGMVSRSVVLTGVGAWCSLIYRMASAIIVQSPGFKARLEQRGVPASKVHVVYNWCNESSVGADHAAAEDLGPELLPGAFRVVFAGTMGRAQALDAVLDAAALVRDRRPRVRFVLIGGGIEVERLSRLSKERGLDNVAILPPVPESEIGRVLKQADVLLVHLRDDPLFRITIPSKVQTYMAAGRPILVAVSGDATDLVQRAGAGLACRPQDPAAIAESVTRLHDMSAEEREAFGRRGREFYWNQLSMTVGVAKYGEVLAGACGSRG